MQINVAEVFAPLDSGLMRIQSVTWDVFKVPVILVTTTLILLFITLEIIKSMKGTRDSEVLYGNIFFKMLWMTFTYSLILSENVFWFPIFEAIVAIPGYLGGAILSAFGGYTTELTGIVGFVDAIYSNFFVRIRTMIEQTIFGLHIWDYVTLMLSVGLLALIYGYFLYQTLKETLVAFITLYALGAFAVVWFTFLIFEETKGIFFHFVRRLCASVLTLTAVAIALALTLSISLPVIDSIGEDSIAELKDKHFGGEWLKLIVGGIFMNILFKTFIMVPAEVMNAYGGSHPRDGILSTARRFTRVLVGR